MLRLIVFRPPQSISNADRVHFTHFFKHGSHMLLGLSIKTSVFFALLSWCERHQQDTIVITLNIVSFKQLKQINVVIARNIFVRTFRLATYFITDFNMLLGYLFDVI
jgi:hypothetical protein